MHIYIEKVEGSTRLVLEVCTDKECKYLTEAQATSDLVSAAPTLQSMRGPIFDDTAHIWP